MIFQKHTEGYLILWLQHTTDVGRTDPHAANGVAVARGGNRRHDARGRSRGAELPETDDGLIDPDEVVPAGTLDVTSTSDCYTETYCDVPYCDLYGAEYEYSRQCCQQGGGYICEDWSRTGSCCTQ